MNFFGFCMYLERAKILNFRGIRRLNVDFEEDSTLMIGENHWGKTSLLTALRMLLGRGDSLCQFDKSDLYVPVKLDTSDTFPEENLVEKVCGRKVVDFESFESKHITRADRHNHNKNDAEANNNHLKEQFSIKTDENIDNSDEFSLTDGHIRIDLYFREGTSGFELDKYPLLKPFWYFCEDGIYRIHWRINSFFNQDTQKFETVHELVTLKRSKKHAQSFEDTAYLQKDAILLLIKLNPVFRLRDSRMDLPRAKTPEQNSHELNTIISMMSNDSSLSGISVKKLTRAFESFFDRYLTSYANKELNQGAIEKSRKVDDFINRPMSLESLSKIRNRLLKPGINRSKALASYIIASMIMSHGYEPLSKDSRPILIFEDIESRFHPSMLLSLWSLIQSSNAQKIVTTNSGDLLSSTPLSCLRRLHRKKYDTDCYKIDRKAFNSDELRHIAFHIRLNRPLSLFARTWILVEGETEVWVINQIASILGLSLACEGIRLIEFAQCGLKPLLKFAMALGINFHVLTDGDDAGMKYAQTVRKYVRENDLDHHLTVLPNRDIEHYLYAQGYEKVFRDASGNINVSNLKKSQAMDRIISAAIKKKSKPLLALLLVEAIERNGLRGVPLAFATLLEETRKLGNSPFL